MWFSSASTTNTHTRVFVPHHMHENHTNMYASHTYLHIHTYTHAQYTQLKQNKPNKLARERTHRQTRRDGMMSRF